MLRGNSTNEVSRLSPALPGPFKTNFEDNSKDHSIEPKNLSLGNPKWIEYVILDRFKYVKIL